MIHWALRRDELCDPGLCPDAPDDGGRCDHCPLDRLEATQASELGHLVRRALELRTALKLGLYITLDDISADEFMALAVVEDEISRWEAERANGSASSNTDCA